MKQWSRRITEQGSDGEDVSQEDSQHQAVIESGGVAANEQKERTIHIGESDRRFRAESTCDRHVVVSWRTRVREQKWPTCRARIQRPRWRT